MLHLFLFSFSLLINRIHHKIGTSWLSMKKKKEQQQFTYGIYNILTAFLECSLNTIFSVRTLYTVHINLYDYFVI